MRSRPLSAPAEWSEVYRATDTRLGRGACCDSARDAREPSRLAHRGRRGPRRGDRRNRKLAVRPGAWPRGTTRTAGGGADGLDASRARLRRADAEGGRDECRRPHRSASRSACRPAQGKHGRNVAYSRGSWPDERSRLQWIAAMEQRFPPLRGRLDAMAVPLDRATFRHPMTGDEMRERVIRLLNLEAAS